MNRVLSAVLLCSAFASAEEPAHSVAALTAEAIESYRAKDYAKFLALEKRALNLDPDNARLSYNVACGEALQRHAAEAVRMLEQLLTRKLDLGAEMDEDFANIRTSPEWKSFEAKLAALRQPVVHSEVAFRLEDPHLMSTGIAVDPQTGDTYIASVRERKIVRRSKNGVVSDFTSPAQDGFLAGVSLALDAPRHLLYASTATAPFMAGHAKQDDGKSGVFVFDLKSGQLVRKALLAVDGKAHFLNTLLLDRVGNAYVADSATSGIYRLNAGESQLEVFAGPGVFQSTQAFAFSDDEKTIYVADFSNGVWVFDVASRTPRKLESPSASWLAGLDGLTRVPDGFIAVQIGVQPARVLRLRMDSHWRKIAGVDILEMNHPDYNGPIQGVLTDHGYLYVANSQLALGNGETGAFAAQKARPTVVLLLPIPSPN